MTPLQQWWAIEADATLTPAERTAQLTALRATTFLAVDVPFVSGDLTIVAITVDGTIVKCQGSGTFSWPLWLHGPPIGIPDPDGIEIAPDGSTWSTAPEEIIANGLRSGQ